MKRTVKKLKLRKEIEELICFVVLGIIIIGGAFVYANRIEKINNGYITVISEDYMAERQG